MKNKIQKPKGYWNKDNILRNSKKYLIKSEFKKHEVGAYFSALRNGWLDEICEHMEELKKPRGYWTKKKCAEEAKKFKNRNAFSQSSASAYVQAIRNGWLDEICEHMEELKKPAGYWTKERCAAEAKKFKNRNVFHEKCPGAYDAARRNRWLDKICAHMEELQKPAGYWTKQRIVATLNECKTRTEFSKSFPSASVTAYKNGWMDEFFPNPKKVTREKKK